MYNKIESLIELKKYQEAIDCYDNLLKINPMDTEALCNKGKNLILLGKYDKALHIFNIVLNQDNNNYNAVEGLYDIYSIYLCDFQQALNQAKILDNLRKDVISKTYMIESFVKTRQFEAARKISFDITYKDCMDITKKSIVNFIILCSYLIEQNLWKAENKLNSLTISRKNNSYKKTEKKCHFEDSSKTDEKEKEIEYAKEICNSI